MDSQLTVLIWGLGGEPVAGIRDALRGVAMVAPFRDGVPLPLAHEGEAPVVLVATDNKGAGFDVVATCRAGGARVVVLGPSMDAELILKALRAGATEFLVRGDHEELKRVVRRLLAPRASTHGGVVTVLPAKGGVGATAIATSFAGALVSTGKRVCLVDLDLHFGDVLSFLDLRGEYSIADVITNMSRLDRDLLESSVTKHASGISVLAQSDKLEEAERVRPADVESLLRFLRQHYDYVVVDGVHGFEEHSLAALDLSDTVLLVLSQDVPAVRNAQRCIEIFRRIGYGENKVKLVLNRFQSHSKISIPVVEEAVGIPVSAVLANDFPAVIGCIDNGVVLSVGAPRSKLTADIARLVNLVRGEPPRRRATKRGLFSTLFSRWS